MLSTEGDAEGNSENTEGGLNDTLTRLLVSSNPTIRYFVLPVLGILRIDTRRELIPNSLHLLNVVYEI